MLLYLLKACRVGRVGPVIPVRRICSSSESSPGNNWRKFIGLSENPAKNSANRAFVPVNYIPTSHFIPSPQVVADLKWLMQKIKLRQDIFLIGPPSRYRSQLVFMMLELLDLEYEYIMLNRDTSESDLKQRKELVTSAMSSVYVDQCVVRAAISGRVLILDGVEKAERNLLPIINNLVENREMQLEDGRFMLPEDRFKKLLASLKKTQQQEDASLPLIPVHGDFRVVAIGLPTPPFRGHNLDPPFRSRFQCRRVTHWPLRDQFLIAGSSAPSMDQDRMSRWLSFANAMASEDIQRKPSHLETIEETPSDGKQQRKPIIAGTPPYFPVDLCVLATAILNNCSQISTKEMIELVYPTKLLDAMTPGCSELVKALAQKFKIWEDIHKSKDGLTALVSSYEISPNDAEGFAEVRFVLPGKDSSFLVPSGGKKLSAGSSEFVETANTRSAMLNMLLAHSVSDFCVVGSRGSGKTANISQFARSLGYGDKLTTVMCYQDMTGRDLLQQRITKANGSTGWEYSPIIRAAIDGNLLILDGIHVLNSSTMLVLKRLVEDREVFLPDGSRGLRHDRYGALKTLRNLTDEQLKLKGVFRIHPAFRLIAVAEPPTASKNTTIPVPKSSFADDKKTKSPLAKSSNPLPISTGNKQSAPGPWLTPDVNGMFLFVQLPPPTVEEEIQILNKLCPNMNEMTQKLVRLTGEGSLSLRQKLRVLRLMEAYPNHDLYEAVTSAALHRFMSLPARMAFSDTLTNAGIVSSQENGEEKHSILIENGRLSIGDVSAPIYSAATEIDGKPSVDNVDEAMRIPSVLFYDNHRQLASMALMLKGLLIGEHLLVIGNQGVGKNRIVDRMLELWSRPRHYAQLHRDSTVQSLTVTPSVTGGKLHFEDSPLVRAVRAGHIMVLDEVDKAPVHVTRVLKGLVESRQMLLPDGRRIAAVDESTACPADVIPLHPDFRLIVLANPPGYPFLGNNFFASLGDLFLCNIVDNPDFESELELVRNYAGPAFDNDLLRRLTAGFAELRTKANDGLLPYPYSTRELISVVKHLAMFPNDTVSDALRNVFDFDSWNESALDAATTSFGKFGITVERPDAKQKLEKRLAQTLQLPPPVKVAQFMPFLSSTELPKLQFVSSTSLKFEGPKRIESHRIAVDQSDGRLSSFSELTRSFLLDLPDHCTVRDAAVTYQKTLDADVLHIYTINPALLISFPLRYDTRSGSMIMLDHLLRSPYLRLHPFQEAVTEGPTLLLFDARSSFASTLNTQTGQMFSYSQPFLPVKSAGDGPILSAKQAPWRSASIVPSNLGADRPFSVVYRPGEDSVSIVDFITGKMSIIKLPFKARTISPSSEKGANFVVIADLSKEEESLSDAFGILSVSTSYENPMTASLEMYSGSSKDDQNLFTGIRGVSVADSKRHVLVPEMLSQKSRNIFSVLTSENDQSRSLASVKRDKSLFEGLTNDKATSTDREVQEFITGDAANVEVDDSLYLPAHSLLVSSLSSRRRYSVGSFRAMPLASTSTIDSVIEVTHIAPPDSKENSTLSLVPITSQGGADLEKSRVSRLLPLSSQDVVSVMSNGNVRVWEVVQGRIQASLSAWQHRLGQQPGTEPDKMELTVSQLLQQKLSEKNKIQPDFKGPKHGKVDPTNAPHVGGNTWAGGSGGRDTAGMGGAGGPYRLDSGNAIAQVPDWVKEETPEHIKKAAREVAQRTYAERLKQIKMSQFDAELYEKYSLRVRREVSLLRNIIESLPSSKNERIWLKNQPEGDLDETRLIEGLTGEKSVYKRRAEPPSDEDRDPSEDKPRLLSLVVDVSGSMARFNSVDLRLERESAAVLMVMESLASQGDQKRVIYDIYGHSGDTDSLELCRTDSPPKNAKERLEILQSMQAHTMFCSAGDSTLSAIGRSLDRIKRRHADTTAEKFVVLFSDANLSRYGIPAYKLREAMTPPDLPQDTRIFAVMIGSLGRQADILVEELPVGQGYVCMDTAMLPRILQQILTTTLLMQD